MSGLKTVQEKNWRLFKTFFKLQQSLFPCIIAPDSVDLWIQLYILLSQKPKFKMLKVYSIVYGCKDIGFMTQDYETGFSFFSPIQNGIIETLICLAMMK